MGRAGLLVTLVLAMAGPGAGQMARAPHIAVVMDGIAPVRENRFAARVLDLHNRERQRVGMPPLAWSDELAADAREWAAELARANRFEHSPARLRRDQGENLFRGTAGAYSLDEMIGDFIEERGDFHPGRFPDVANDGSWENVGHYTQLIWPRTREVGCAVVRGGEWDLLACRYAPAGNVIGMKVP